MQDYLRGDAAALAADKLASSRGLLFHLYPLLCDFLLFVTPPAGSMMLSNKSTRGSSVAFTAPIQLPAGFTLGRIGQQGGEGASGSQEPHDPRILVRALLEQVRSAWDL
jgi:hypothetical protein